MISVRKRAATRLAATALATGLFAGGLLAAAGTAAADGSGEQTAAGNGAVLATLANDGHVVTGARVDVPGEGHLTGGLFELEVQGGGTLRTYCIDFDVQTQPNVTYKETGWDSSSLAGNENAGRIHWILQNSYPQVDDLDELQGRAGLDSEGLTLTEETAAAGTQAAIWRYSDPQSASGATPADAAAAALTAWLYEHATDVTEPTPSLELTPPEVSGKPGQKLGPVTVDTNADSVVITPDESATAAGVFIVDAQGNAIAAPVADGAELFFDVPPNAPDGSTSFTASITDEIPVGRAFTGLDVETQAMILASSTSAEASRTATATWAADGPSPAFTATESCADSSVVVTVGNGGDRPFVFTYDGGTHTVEAGGEPVLLTVPVENKANYRIDLYDAEGSEVLKSFTGMLDCEVEPTPTPTPSPTPSNDPTPDGGSDDPNLAETGSNGNVGLIAGIAVALLVVGGAAVIVIRKRS